MQTEIFGATGRRGTGKSTFLALRLRKSQRILVWDPLAEHTFLPNSIRSLDELEGFLDWTRGKSAFAARYIPQDCDVDEFDEFCWHAYRRGRLVLAVEEIPLVASAGQMPKEFGRVVRLSRHRGIAVAWTAQRFAETPRTLTALTDTFALFGVSEPRDLDALMERCGVEIGDAVATVSLHEGIFYDVRDRSAVRILSTGEDLGPLQQGNDHDNRGIHLQP